MKRDGVGRTEGMWATCDSILFLISRFLWILWEGKGEGEGEGEDRAILRDPSSLCLAVLKWKEVVWEEWREDSGSRTRYPGSGRCAKCRGGGGARFVLLGR
jgi:hypothetical protein